MSKKSTEMLTIPVVAIMRQRPDGSYAMVEAEYAQFPADTLAQKLFCAFGHIPQLKPENDE